jgi:hypothetical protein
VARAPGACRPGACRTAVPALAALAAAWLGAGCDASIGDPTAIADSGAAAVADAAPDRPVDAARQLDAGAADARPVCAEGNDRVEDPDTGTCYSYFSAALSWADAQAACADLGGHLLVVTDLAENELASRIAPSESPLQDIWIGATDEAREDDFAWVDGEPFAFEHWRDGEPNDGGDSGEDCAIFEGDNNIAGEGCLWDDRDCGDPRPYLCERP